MSLFRRSLALTCIGGLAALAGHQNGIRLRQAFDARHLVDETAALRNEIAWLDAQVQRLGTPAALLARARDLAILPEGPVGETVRAPARAPDGDAGN